MCIMLHVPRAKQFEMLHETVPNAALIGQLVNPKNPNDRQLRKTIDGLRELERKCFASRSRFAFYDYLAAVFELYRSTEAKESSKTFG
jgi:hypothetical protein